MQSQIQRPDRLEKLIPVMAIAMYWAVSCGLAEEAASPPNPTSKKCPLPLLAVQTRLAVLQKILRFGRQASKALGTVEFMRDGKGGKLTHYLSIDPFGIT